MLKPWWRHNWFVEFFLYFTCTTLKELCRIKKKFLDFLYQSIKISIYNLKSIWRGDKELVWCRFLRDCRHSRYVPFVKNEIFSSFFFSFIFCRKHEFNRWFSLCLTESHRINQRYYNYDASISLKEFITWIS